MERRKQNMLTEEQIASNPAVDLALVDEAERARRQLERLGVWQESGSRVRNPYANRPDVRPYGQQIQQLINQSPTA